MVRLGDDGMFRTRFTTENGEAMPVEFDLPTALQLHKDLGKALAASARLHGDAIEAEIARRKAQGETTL